MKFIENLDDGEYYPDSEFSDNNDYDENSFCNLSDADENNTDDLRFVRNGASKKLTFETLSETLNEQNYDHVVPPKKIYKANVGKVKVLTWTTDKPNVSRKRNESNIICNKSGPSRRVKDIKTLLDSWSLLMTNDILLVTNTNKNIEAFVNEHVGFDENDKITYTKPSDIHEIRALIGLFYLRGALNQNLHSVKDLFCHDFSCDVFVATMKTYEILFSVSDGTI